MRWLLVSTCGRNPGDEFSRIGVQRLVASVDPKARVQIADKHVDYDRRFEFDRAVLCGMPLFWSHGRNNNWTQPWWPWLLSMGKKLLVLGAGSYAPPDGPPWSDPGGVLDSAHAIARAVYAGTVRDRIAALAWDTVTPDPAAFAVGPGPARYDLCNLMEHGGNEPQFGPRQSMDYKTQLPGLARRLIVEDRVFVAHDAKELALARRLGFGRAVAYDGDPVPLLRAYARAKSYVGCRLHGAIVVKALGRPVEHLAIDARTRCLDEIHHLPDACRIYTGLIKRFMDEA